MKTPSKKRHFDDLTQIKGIGQSTQQWLRESFDIFEYSDLARLSAADLEEKLKAAGKISSRHRIEQWISQAAELASEPASPKAVADDAAENSALWRRVATFVVVFEESKSQTSNYQTTVHHMEADVTESWGKIEKEELADWIIQQMGLETDAVEDAKLDEPVAEVAQPMTEPIQAEAVAELASSDRMQTYIARATALVEQSSQRPEATTDTQSSPARLDATTSKKMQDYIAKANAWSGQNSPEKVETPQTVSPDAESEKKSQVAPYSERLQAYVNKANALLKQG